VLLTIGRNRSNPKEEIVWDSNDVINGHWIIVGGSGTGKTYQIKNIISQVKQQGVSRIHIFDPHGDISTSPDYTSSVRFSESAPYGINPLTVNPDPYYGGVRRRINSFIGMINRYSAKLDYRQEAALRYLLQELYSTFGFENDKPDTWACKTTPTLIDLINLVSHNLKSFFVGHMHAISTQIDYLSGQLLHLRRLNQQMPPNNENDKNITALKDNLKTMFAHYIDNLTTGDEIDRYIKYDSQDTLKAIYDRMENLRALGIFKTHQPPFNPAQPIWHYDMRNLYVEEQGYLVELTLEQIFIKATQEGFKDEIDTLVFVDEAQRFISPDTPDHIIAVISREARKFGIGLVLATQNCSNFSEDIIINSGSKMILGVDEAYLHPLSKSLGIEPNRIRFTHPRKSALVQFKSKKASSDGRFIEVLF